MSTSPAVSAPTANEDIPAGAMSVEYFLNCPTGVVEHYFASPDLHWSDELYRIHGYERGEIVPTLELGISHFDPTDRHGARALWETLLREGGPVSGYFSLRDAHGKTRKVLISGDHIRRNTPNSENAPADSNPGRKAGIKADGEPIGVWALVVDLTKSVHDDTQRVAHEAVIASAMNRAVIEQAKGILMGLGGLTADQAFEHISQRSQDTNRKVIAVSQAIIDRASQLSVSYQPRSRAELLLDLVYPPLPETSQP